jgi:hypothetical protein
VTKKTIFIIGALAIALIVSALYQKKQISEYKETNERLEVQKHSLTELYESSSKSMQEQFKSKEEVYKNKIEEVNNKIHTLSIENTYLKKSTKTQILKIIKPDGTIIEKELHETSSEEQRQLVTEITQEFNTKIASIETRWMTIHQERVEEIKKDYDLKIENLQKENRVLKSVSHTETTIGSDRKLGLGLGLTKNMDYQFHGKYSVIGPLYGLSTIDMDGFSVRSFSLGLGWEF